VTAPPPAVFERTRYPNPMEIGAASALSTMGALPLGQVPTGEAQGSPTAYAIGAVGGAGVGGLLVGFVSAGDAQGAFTGSLLTMGLASMASSFSLLKSSGVDETSTKKTLGFGLGIMGLLGIGAAIYLAGARRRR
jgi:hypothetical protein